MQGRSDYLWEGLLTWLVIGSLTGYLLGYLSKRVNTGKSVLGDVGAGLVGALAAGVLPRLFIAGRVGLYLSVLTAFLGAVGAASAWRAATQRAAG